MRSSFSRVAIATALTGSLWLSAIAGFAAPQQQKQPDQQKQPTQSTAPVSQSSASTEQATDNSAGKTDKTPVSSGKSLSTNEDPNLIGKRNINKGIIARMSGSIEKEVALGRQLSAEVDRENKFIDDPVITEYVNRVGQNIVVHSDAKVPFTIKVIDSDEVNAFALPGGFFYVNKGLILAADNEAELAGVMAHEIAHVCARHAVENATKMQLLDYGMLAGMIFMGGIPGMVLQNTGGLGEMLAFMKFSRGAEEEADRLGVQYLYAAGYDPNALATMFEKLSAQNKKKPGAVSRAFASHPQPPDRRAASLALVARFPEREEYVVSTSEFQKVKGRLLRMSNARASSSGDLATGNDPSSGRPTLKRRNTNPDDTSATPDGGTTQQQPSTTTSPSGPPKLKRNPGSQPDTQQNQPSTTP
jgi:predicted Zn-dependent protease